MSCLLKSPLLLLGLSTSEGLSIKWLLHILLLLLLSLACHHALLKIRFFQVETVLSTAHLIVARTVLCNCASIFHDINMNLSTASGDSTPTSTIGVWSTSARQLVKHVLALSLESCTVRLHHAVSHLLSSAGHHVLRVGIRSTWTNHAAVGHATLHARATRDARLYSLSTCGVASAWLSSEARLTTLIESLTRRHSL